MKTVSEPIRLSALGLVVNPERDDEVATASHIRAWAKARGVSVSDDNMSNVDLVVSLGGDGTVLRAVQLVGDSLAPVLGVNCGTLGYLTTIEPEDAIEVLESLHAGTLPTAGKVDERMLLRVEVSKVDGSRHTLRGLNEMVVEKVESGHTVRLEVAIDNEHFATYSADGLIVATPTGSTAYSLSARGPVVSPAHRALILTPVSPHMLFDRALVLDPAESVSVAVRGHRSVSLAVDGLQFVALDPGDTVVVSADSHVARFIQVGRRGFHQILRVKFGLGVD